MGKSAVKLTFKRGAIQELAGLLHGEIQDRAQAVADACNAESQWGGYESGDASGDWPRARVWNSDSRNDEARDQRLIKALDAGS